MLTRSSDEVPRGRSTDLGLSALLVVQIATLFIALPLNALNSAGPVALDVCHLAFAALCVGIFTRHRGLRAALLIGLAGLAFGPLLRSGALGLSRGFFGDLISLTALTFNGIVTGLVARQVFAGGAVNAHRVQGAVLLYLNVVSLFAIVYGIFEAHVHGAFMTTGGAPLPGDPGARAAAMSYFSLATITTTGYGDIVPVHAGARSLANLESVFGQLYPATLLARLVGLHLAHAKQEDFRIE